MALKNEILRGNKVNCSQVSEFASLFGFNFLEISYNVINVDGISTKTIKRLSHFFYTQKLLTSWTNADIVVDFSYAAGKYQIVETLKMLDDILGLDINASESDVELLKITQQLALKNAKARMLKRIICKINQSVSGTETLDSFQLEPKHIDDENFTVVHI